MVKISKIPTEYQECKAYWSWAQHHTILREYLIKHVNEGKRSYVSAKYLQLIGMRKGLPDYQLPIPNNKFHSLWLEMKRINQKNRKKDTDQLAWQERLLRAGHCAIFVYGWEDAAKITIAYLNNKI